MMALACMSPSSAVGLDNMKGFEALFGHYGPQGDCTKYPQVVIDAAGFALDQGKGKVERANQPEYAASFMGDSYVGIAKVFFPYWKDGAESRHRHRQCQREARHAAGRGPRFRL